MSEAKHTPGPLHVGPYYKTDIYSRTRQVAGALPFDTAQGRADARRLVECWNACEGMDDPQTAVRDLLAACEAEESIWSDLATRGHMSSAEIDRRKRAAQDMRRAAIKKARGEG